MSNDILKAKLFKMMRQEDLISDNNTTATLFSLTKLRVEFEEEKGWTSSSPTGVAFTGFKPEAGRDNRIPTKLGLT